MRKDESSYFEEPAFRALLNKYEGMVKSHTPCYFDSHELIDISFYYVNQKRMNEAYKAIRLCNELHPDDTDTTLTLASILFDTGHFDEARQIADRIVETNDLDVIIFKGNFLAKDNKEEELRQLLNEVSRRISDDDLWTYAEIFRQSTRIEKKDLAGYWFHYLETHFDLDMETDRHDFLCEEICAYLTSVQDYEKTAHYLTIYLDNHPYDLEHWIYLCQAYYFCNKKQEALTAIDFAMAIDDNEPRVLKMKAELEEQSGNLDAAISAYSKLVNQAEPGEERREYIVKYTQLTIQKMNQQDGINGLIDAAEEPQKITDMHSLTLMACDALACGNQAKARYYYERAKEGMSSSPIDFYGLGTLALKMDELPQALDCFNLLLSLIRYPTKEMYLPMIGEELMAHGHYSEAADYFAIYINDNPDKVYKASGPILLALMETERLKDLYEWYDKLLFMDPEVFSQFSPEQKERLTEAVARAKDFLGPSYFENQKLDF